MSPCVTVCLPVYRAANTLAEALESAQCQTHARLRILVSVDDAGADDHSSAICRRLQRSDPRIELFEQADRLGWVGNTNFLLDRVDSELFCVLFQDDYQHPAYIEACLARFAEAPEAVSVSGDLRLFGGSEDVIQGYDYSGDVLHRALGFLGKRRHSFALRCLTRTEVLDDGARLEQNEFDGYFANHAFALELLAAGRCLHTSHAGYFKAVRNDSVTAGWRGWPYATALAAWTAHGRDCRKVLSRARLSPHHRELLTLCLDIRQTAHVRELQCHPGYAGPQIQDKKTGPPNLGSPTAIVRRFPVHCRPLVASLLARLLFFDGVLAQRRDEIGTAADRLEQCIALCPEHEAARRTLQQVRRACLSGPAGASTRL